jgi:hypothetical protein
VCLTCGCRHQGDDDHGDDDNITWDDLEDAADAADIDPETAAINLLSATEHEVDKSEYSGSVLKADAKNHVLLMVAYSCNKMPHRGADGYRDIVSAETLQKACWRFMENGCPVNVGHQGGYAGATHIVENYTWPSPTPWVIKGANGSEQVVRQGDWLVAFKLDDADWEAYEKGLIGAASPEGDCRRIAPRPETLAAMRGDAA